MSQPSIDTIKRLCAASFRVSLLDMDSARRDRPALLARHSAMWLARRLTRHSSPAIGRHFGQRDHTTVLNAISRMDDRIARNDPEATVALSLLRQFEERQV